MLREILLNYRPNRREKTCQNFEETTKRGRNRFIKAWLVMDDDDDDDDNDDEHQE
jgi:hypothetical protein